MNRDLVASPGDLPPGPDSLAILFVCGADFTGPSEKQVLWAARELIARGHRVMASLHGDPSSAVAEGADEVPGLELRWHRFRGRRVLAGDVAAARRFRPDVLHVWNSRTATVAAARSYARATNAAVLVHWEDDEWGQLDGIPAGSAGQRLRHAARRIVGRAQPPVWNLSTRWSLGWVMEHARAFDALAPVLAGEVTQRTGRECAVIFPISPPEAWEPAEPAPKLPAEISSAEILLYTGDINFGRAGDIELALAAVAEVQRRGFDVAFVHAGRNTAGIDLEAVGRGLGIRPGTVAELGNLPYARVPALLRRATILLQPGRLTTFNRFTLPAKLQSYLASGTPCITFAAGPGELFTDRVEVLKTYTGEPSELAERIIELLSDSGLRARLRENAPRAARRLFDPATNAEALLAHYRAALAQQPR